MQSEPKRPAIEVRQLTKTYTGGVEAVKAIDFDVATGEVWQASETGQRRTGRLGESLAE